MYRNNNLRRFVRHILRTWKQKLYAIGMVALGVLATVLCDGDATLLVLMLCFAVPMFFSRRADWIV